MSAKDQMFLSKKLGTIRRDAPLEIKTLDEIRYDGIKKENVVPYFEKNGFSSLIKRLNGEGAQEKKSARKGRAQSNTLF